jgi:hypothetical protein
VIFNRLTALVAVLLALSPTQALAWGATGHRIIGRLAVQALPPEVPAFLRTPRSAEAVGELAREPDRWKDAGRTHDSDRDPGHFLDLDDEGKVLGGPALTALPLTRAEYESALRAAGTDSWKAGYLSYSIVDGWQQLAKDFALLRLDAAGARNTHIAAHRAWLLADAERRRSLILRDLGALAHYVGDGSQPLHVSVHFNGWGPYPNPEGFTQDKVHAPFEGAFVRANITEAQVRARITALTVCAKPLNACTADYLTATNAQTAPFYQLQKAGAFAPGDPRGKAFAAERLAAGASELRDIVVMAWRASATGQGGWPAAKVADVEAGRVDPYDALVASD